MSGGAASGRGSGALTLPLLVFLTAFFLWPLTNIFSTAVSNPAVHDNFPRLAQVAGEWDGQSAPTQAMQRALIDDIRAATDQQAFGDAVRILNADKSGFRTLLSKTRTTLLADQAAGDLSAIDRRWSDIAYWQAMVSNLPRFTDRFLLAAVDLRHDQSGAIVPVDASSSLHVDVLLRTLGISALVTAICAAIGLPYAIVMATTGARVRKLMLAAVLIPLWTSSLVRVTAWFILLQNNGVLNDSLLAIGLTSAPMPLLFSRVGVIIAMVHLMLPFMVLPIYSVLMAVPRNLVPAAMSLGATPLRAVLHVLVPLSLRGVATGTLFVFMTSLGFYILPALLGGPTDQLVSSLIAAYALANANWPMASALGLLLLISTMALYFVHKHVSERQKVQP